MRRALVATLSILALAGGTAARLATARRRPGPALRRPSTAPARAADPVAVARASLLYVLPPVWLAVGIADWLCHRRARIEVTAGVKESLLHLAMEAELGIPSSPRSSLRSLRRCWA